MDIEGSKLSNDVRPNEDNGFGLVNHCNLSSRDYFDLEMSDQPPLKRLRLSEKPSDFHSITNSLLSWKSSRLNYIRDSYNRHLLELYFLNNQGILVDFPSWLKSPSAEILDYVRRNKLQGDNQLDESILCGNLIPKKEKGCDSYSSKKSHSLKHGKDNFSIKSKNSTQESDNSQEQMVEKARYEASVVQRIAALRKEGVWGERRLPKVHEPSRQKTHWDYLLEEMVWLSADFTQERKWKKAAAKKCAKMVTKYFQDRAQHAQRAEKEQEIKLKKIAAFVGKEVRIFWGNVGKIIEYKVNAQIDEKKKKAMDQQLSFIVDQTEKYSSMLAQSMIKPMPDCTNDSVRSETPNSLSDGEFQPCGPSDDDEATIQCEDDNPVEQASEVAILQRESEQTLEELLEELPKGYLDDSQGLSLNGSEYSDDTRTNSSPNDLRSLTSDDGDKDFDGDGVDEEDDERTIQEEEDKVGREDYAMEINELEADNELSVEELRRKYLSMDDPSEPMSEKTDDEDSANLIDNASGDESDGTSDGSGDVFGLKDLMEENEDDVVTKERGERADQELKEAAAVAESLQPKGFTLSSTTVTVPVPFLLKHTLREYQHVGLEWMVTMYDKKLNGVLADEMGLGKTIQTIALLAHLACNEISWGPHLIVVPTSVMLNWEMELKKWCPAFKILTYYGSQKERKLKRHGWTKPNAFHVCITSYKLVIQDHQSFRRKKWKYLILDEAQNIKNFKSQRWQLLLNFQTDRRLLLTGTPLQNSLMELWSLMHFLMPNVFSSHREFREWFSNPLTGMIEGNKEYNDSIIKRLHKVLRPFILRRLKSEVEQQMPKKYEHVVMCKLSKRQRFLYEEFLSRSKTKDTLTSGNFLSVINILMQLRKVCNHPNLFEPRPTISPFLDEGIIHSIPSEICDLLTYCPLKHIDFFSQNLLLCELELCLTAFAAHRIRRFQASQKLIQTIDDAKPTPPRCPAGKIKLHVRPSSQPLPRSGITSFLGGAQRGQSPSVLTLKPVNAGTTAGVQNQTATTSATSPWQSGVRFQLVQHGSSYKAIPLPPGSTGGMLMQQTPQGPRLLMPQRAPTAVQSSAATGVTATTTTSTSTGTVSGLQLVQTSTGQYLLTSAPVQNKTPSSSAPTTSIGVSGNTAVALLQRLQGLKGLQGSVITTGTGGRPVLRLPTASLRTNVPMAPLTTSPLKSVSQPPPSQTPSPMPSPMPSPSKSQASSQADLKVADLAEAVTTTTTTSISTSISGSTTATPKKKEETANKSIFYLNDLEERNIKSRKEKLEFLSILNTRKCHACPIYGSDLMDAVSFIHCVNNLASVYKGSFNGQGLIHCLNATPNTVHINNYWKSTKSLYGMVDNVETYLDKLKPITDRFVFCVPPVISKIPLLRVCHPQPSLMYKNEQRGVVLRKALGVKSNLLHSIINKSVIQFPDPRLIQYDCGKLQILNKLLRRLKDEGHRVLIFTQMTRMLDVFETFLNYHGHLYLRLDGATKVEQRQILMERFNQDTRIFAFILSTRSGGIGVNLTGADTVIFYDSDWNPTMDAQAQDRCHRIGQTKDVHIYRLISERTIEENIFKKANQKRLLGELAIEGGNFTTAHLKEQTIQDLFKMDSSEKDAAKRMDAAIPLEANQKDDQSTKQAASEDFESALAACEDETDAQAMQNARAEAAADLAEFDENIPLQDDQHEAAQEMTKAEIEVANLMKQLSPIEQYALTFLEYSDCTLKEEAERVIQEIDQQKKEWEEGRLLALREEEKRRKKEEEELCSLTYSAKDARNKIWISNHTKETMPMWRPPTPPHEETDLYIDRTICDRYEEMPMTEYELPAIYIKKENNKRIKIEPLTPLLSELSPMLPLTPVKIKQEDSLYVPRSLFDRPSPALLKMRRDWKLNKFRDLSRSSSIGGPKPHHPFFGVKSEIEPCQEYLIHEDWAIVQGVTKVLQLPINLLVLSPGHIPNWDLVADLVNSYSICYRSSKNCRARYEAVLQNREESKDSDSPDMTSRKIKKQKLSTGVGQSTRGLGTSQLFQQDNNSKYTSLCSTRFETLKAITINKSPTAKPLMVTPSPMNDKHAQKLLDNGIDYEDPLDPAQVASNRSERIQREQREKHKTQQTQDSQHHHQTGIHQPTAINTLQHNSTGSIVGAASAFSTITGKAINTVSNSGSINASTSGMTANTGFVRASIGTNVAGTSRSTTLTLQDIQGRVSTANLGSVVSVTTMSQIQAAKLTASLSQANTQRGMSGSGTIPTKTFTPQQMQYLRHAQRQTLALHSGAKVVATASASNDPTIKRVQISSPNPLGQKVQVAVSGGNVPAITAIQVVKGGGGSVTPPSTTPGSIQGSGGSNSPTIQGGKTLARAVTESEMNAILRRQQPQQIAKVGQIAQMLAKQRGIVGVKGSTVGIQLGTKTNPIGSLGGLGTVQILQGTTQKQMTVQQFQQVLKQVQQPQTSNFQQTIPLSGATVKTFSASSVVGSSGVGNIMSGGTAKLIPVTLTSEQPIKQTIQVVSATNTPTTSLRSTGLTLQGNTVRASSPGILSQVSAVLQSQQSVSTTTVRSQTMNPIRIQTTTATTSTQQTNTENKPDVID